MRNYRDQNSSKAIYEVFGNVDPRYANRTRYNPARPTEQSSRYQSNPNERLFNRYPQQETYSTRNSDYSPYNSNNSTRADDYLSRNNDIPSRRFTQENDCLSPENDYPSYTFNCLSQKNDYSSDNSDYKTNNYLSRKDSYSSEKDDYLGRKDDHLSRNSINRSNYSSRKDDDYLSPENDYLSRRTSSQEVSFKGIRNLGNTCFINSSLQVLLNLPQFISDMIDSLGRVDQESNSFIREICRMYYEYSSSKKSSIQINKFYDILKEKISFLGDGSQHDVAEFFQLFAESCESEILPSISSINRKGDKVLSKTKMLLYDPFMKNFGFSVITNVVCGKCGCVITEEVQSNFVLQIPFVSQTLDGCLSRTFSEEKIETTTKVSDYNPYAYRRYRTNTTESNSGGYCCKRCSNKTSFNLRTSLYRIPRFFIIQIARFDTSLTKNSSPINVPDRIDLQQYLNEQYFAGPDPILVRNKNDIDTSQLYSLDSENSDLYSYKRYKRNSESCPAVFEDEQMKRNVRAANASYHLNSIVLHEGSFLGGHYTAAIKTKGTRNNWTVISDGVVLENSSFSPSLPYCFIYQID